MENEKASNETYKHGIWTPWAQVLAPEVIGQSNFPEPPSDEKWQQWTTPSPLEEGNAVTFCDRTGELVQLKRNVAEEHTLVYELRSMGFEAVMGQTGGMNSACLVDVANEVKWDDEVESPSFMYICADEYGDQHFYIEVHSDEGIVAEVDWAEMAFPDKSALMTWINDNSEKLAPLVPDGEKMVDELVKEAKQKLEPLRSDGRQSLDDLIKEVKEKMDRREPDPDRPEPAASKKSPEMGL